MRGIAGLNPVPCQWAAAGYAGAITSGHTICGTLFGGSIFLGYLHGKDASQAPEIDDTSRKAAIASVNGLFCGFLEQFNDTGCQPLTGCDWGKAEDQERYMRDELWKHKCSHFFKYVIEYCTQQIRSREGRDRIFDQDSKIPG
jgi:hypothetical protein